MSKVSKKLLKQSDVRRFTQQLIQGKYTPSKLRQLKAEEVEQLEAQGNQCDDWGILQVALQFDASKIRFCTFGGHVILPQFFGSLRTPDGLSLQTGMEFCHVYHSIIENSHLSQISTLSQMIISTGCVVRHVGSLVNVGTTSFGIGRQLSIGSETGGRTIASFPEMTHEIAWQILGNKDDLPLQTEFQSEIEAYSQEVNSKFGFLDESVIIQNTQTIRNSWIGSGALIEGANKILNSVILSTPEQSTIVSDGAIIESAALQWGAKVMGHSIVTESILQEEVSIEEQAHIHYSFIGSNTAICRGQVVSSLLGPFMGFRHQGLLISVLWPEGRGNAAQGINIGSNHTGRQPDQECFIARGCFFGLGSSVQFPLHMMDSPWTLIAANTHLLPQRIEFPFSLIMNRSDQTQIRPAWVYGQNAFMLTRCEKKFTERNKSRRHTFNTYVLEDKTTRLVLKAVRRLQGIKNIKSSYTERDIPGLGKCVLEEPDRQRAIQWYLNYLERYALYRALDVFEEKPKLLESSLPVVKELFRGEIMRDISKLVEFPGKTILILKRFRTGEKHWKESILSSLAKDDAKGETIQEDYSYTHPGWEVKNPWIENDYQAARVRCQRLIDQARE